MPQTKEERESVKEKSKKRFNVVLTIKEAEEFERIMQDYGCQNASQLIKKICNKELTSKQEW